MKLYSFHNSSSSYRVRIALNLKGLAPEMAYVNLTQGEQHAPDYAAVNAQMIVPTLIDNGQVFSQSLAIMEYLEEAYPAPSLLPNNAWGRAYVRELSLIIAADTSPLGNLKVRKYLESEIRLQSGQVRGWIQHWIEDGLAAFEKRLEAAPENSRFCYGDMPGMADCCLIPQLYNADRWGCDISGLTRILAIREACEALPAFHAAHPSQQADAPH